MRHTDLDDHSPHAVRFFHGDDLPLERIARHLSKATPLVIATDEHRERIRAALPPARAAVGIFLDATEIADKLTEGGRPSRLVFDELVGATLGKALERHARIRAYGEIVDVLARRGDIPAAIQLEEWWNELLEGKPVELLCGYSLLSFAGTATTELFSRVCETHDQEPLALLYERAEKERQRAEAANRAKDEFLAMLGHELRNPLSPILTAVQLMRLRAGDILVRERTIIENQVNHMVRLVDDLLDVSRITRGKVQLRRHPIEISRVVAQAVEIASPLLEERAHRLTTTVPTSGLRVDA